MKKCFIGSTSVIVDDGENMDLKYYLIKEEKTFEDTNDPITTYGVEIDKNNIEREIIRDVSVNEAKVNKVISTLISTLISNQVTPIHLYDVIENFL